MYVGVSARAGLFGFRLVDGVEEDASLEATGDEMTMADGRRETSARKPFDWEQIAG